MKKLTLLALLFCAVGATAQISMGVRAGVNFTKIIVKNGTNTKKSADNLTGANIAIPFEFKVSNMFSVQPELAYSQRGLKESETIKGTKYTYKLILNYFELPSISEVRIWE